MIALATLLNTTRETAKNKERMSKIIFLLFLVLPCVLAFHGKIAGAVRHSRSVTRSSDAAMDPNFEEHLPELLKRGQAERSSPDIAADLRKRYATIASKKREAATEIRKTTKNEELAAELEEIADELAQTSEKFVALAETYDAWSRPSPDLASDLRRQEEEKKGIKNDPTFLENLPRMMKAGLKEDRPEPDLPSALRMQKYKNKAFVNRLAAKELSGTNKKMSEEMASIAEEIEESHNKFVELLEKSIKNKEFKYNV